MFSTNMQPTEIMSAASVGAASFFLWRLMTARLPGRCESKGAKIVDDEIPESLALGASDDVESNDEPGAEPSPEPSPDDSSSFSIESGRCCQHAKARSDVSQSEAARKHSLGHLVLTALLLLLILCVSLCIPCQLQSSPDLHQEPDQLVFAPSSRPEIELQDSTDRTADQQAIEETVEDSLPSQVEDTDQAQRALAEEDETKDDDVSGGKVVTLNLTRQRMLIPGGKKGVLYYKSAYWGIVQVGTPAVSFKVVFDTGSGHLVLPSTYCKSNACTVHKRYKRSASSSAVDIDYDGTVVQKGSPRDKLTVSFGTGEISGVFVEETVCMEDFNSFGDRQSDELPAVPVGKFDQGVGCMKMRMIIATDMTEDPFETFKFDGVLGMGLSGLSQAPEFNFMHVVGQSIGGWGGKTPDTFAFFLGENHEVSKLTLGGYEKDKADGDLKWNPVWRPELGHWLLEIKSIYIDGNEVNFCKDGTCRAVVDTGTSLMAVPTAAFPEVFSQLRHKASDGDCQGPGPNLHFELEAITVTIEPQEYARLEENKAQNMKKWPKFVQHEDNETTSTLQRDFYCKPMLMAMDLPEPIGPKLFILGEPVLRKYYSVYDTGKPPRVGLARAVHADFPQDDDADDESWFDDEDE